ncbi:MAG TPA: DUF389 domain-containing protein [Flavilitoribacter sp.]|nr:DUF389 domain-containing protein [Flavilitoribacter sp.]HMQ86532.1 DUF389 domain-containing protein [Flavilitoribacter sp.]
MPDKRQKQTIGDLFNQLVYATRDWFRDLMDLREGQDRAGTVAAIKSGNRMRGSNAWMLMCSIMIASLGLDLNSPAVIIGAMLISPLMNPILGVGLAVGTNDQETLLISLRNFTIAILIALFTSTAYFLVTPLGTLTNEIQARTAPTFLDGLVAVFGGVAGIISVSRKDKSNAIPGVAIATALMPPLCVTGYGIAKGNFDVMLNSFYLFFLNSFFIALTTYFIIRLLRFPYRSRLVDPAENRRNRYIVLIFSLLITIPGLYILRKVIADLRYKQNVKAFVEDNLRNVCLNYKTFPIAEDSTLLVVQLMGRTIPEDSIPIINELLHEKYALAGTYLRPIPDYGVELERLDKVQYEVASLGTLSEQLKNLADSQRKEAEERKLFYHHLDSLRQDSIPIGQITREARSVYSQLLEMGYALSQQSDGKNPPSSLPLFLVHWDTRKPEKQRRQDETSLKSFLLERTNLDTLALIGY